MNPFLSILRQMVSFKSHCLLQLAFFFLSALIPTCRFTGRCHASKLDESYSSLCKIASGIPYLSHLSSGGWNCSSRNLPLERICNVWRGVSCDASKSAITALNLNGVSAGNGGGYISSAIGNLVSLQYIGLAFNDLGGTIPVEITNATSLKYMDLRSNSLTGSIPFEIMRLSYLLMIDTDENSLKGTIPASLGYLQFLTSLSLSNNFFTGSIPQEISLLSSLTYLKLSSNSLNGTIPLSIGFLSNLSFLNLYDNCLEGTIPPTVGNLSSLSSFAVSGNLLTGTIPSSLGKLAALTSIALYDNELSGTIPEVFGVMNISKLAVFGNALSGTIPFFRQSTLELFAVHYNRLEGRLPSSLGQNTKMLILSTTSNRLTGTIPPSLGNLRRLQILILAGNRFTGQIPSALGKLVAANTLHLYANKLVGTVPTQLGMLKNLTSFRIDNNSLSGTIPTELCALTALRTFSVIQNQFTCFTTCLPAPTDDVLATIPHCLSEQDTAICDLVMSSNVGDAIRSRVFFKSVTVQNYDHPYVPSTVESFLVNVSGTFSYSVTFDVRTSTVNGQDTVRFCSTSTCTGGVTYGASNGYSGGAWSFPGVGGRSALKITASYFYVLFTVTSQASSMWGFKFTALSRTAPGTGWNCTAVSTYKSQVNALIHHHPIEEKQLYGKSVFHNHTDNNVQWHHHLTGQSLSPSPQLSSASLSNLLPSAPSTLSSTAEIRYYATDLCNPDSTWSGVVCSGAAVTQIDLSAYNIYGTIPTSIALLTSLQSLNLRFNSFSGTLSSAIGLLTTLQFLDLSGNALRGTIPETIGSLQAALQVFLGHNGFTGTIPTSLGKISAILELSLTANSLEGVLPSELCAIRSATIDITRNSAMTCFESQCWNLNITTDTHHYFGSLPYCAPTGQPTSMPTQPTSQPTFRPKPNSVNNSGSQALSQTTIDIIIIVSVVGGCCALSLIALVAVLLWKKMKKRAKKSRYEELRNAMLKQLPVHRVLRQRCQDSEEILRLINEHRSTLGRGDFESFTAFDLALQWEGIDDHVFTEILLDRMFGHSDDDQSDSDNPIANDAHAVGDPHEQAIVHCDAWTLVVQKCIYVNAVKEVLQRYPHLARALAECKDSHGREALHIASPANKVAILQSLYLFQRYELISPLQPHHESATCLVHLAVDHDDMKKKVAIKFIREKSHFQTEISVRSCGNFSDAYVVNILRTYDSNDDPAIGEELQRRGFDEYPFCFVMPAGDRTIADILQKEQIAGQESDRVRQIIRQVALAVQHIHSRGYIHGDLKPLNILRVGEEMKLIDLDASACFTSGHEFAGKKYSSGFLPPEMVFCCDDRVCVRSTYDVGRVDDDDISDEMVIFDDDVDLVLAAPAQDIWALGVVVYYLVAAAPLFLCNNQDHLDNNDLRILSAWTDEVKSTKLSKIRNTYARNLVSQMLSKEPSRRPTIDRVLSHPYLTGRTATRLVGERPSYDVFLSYRVAADKRFAEFLYDRLRAAGLRVWWDRASLLPGEPWEQGFCRGLIMSRAFVPLLSRRAIRSSFEKMTADSGCDSILLEYRFAIELRDMGLIEKIFPVFIGDRLGDATSPISGVSSAASSASNSRVPSPIPESMFAHAEQCLNQPDADCDGDDPKLSSSEKRISLLLAEIAGEYLRYEFSGPNPNHPACPPVVVKSVEAKLRRYLEEEGLGLPLHEDMTVAEIVGCIVQFHGGFIEGDAREAMFKIVGEISKMMKTRQRRRSSGGSNLAKSHSNMSGH